MDEEQQILEKFSTAVMAAYHSGRNVSLASDEAVVLKSMISSLRFRLNNAQERIVNEINAARLLRDDRNHWMQRAEQAEAALAAVRDYHSKIDAIFLAPGQSPYRICKQVWSVHGEFASRLATLPQPKVRP